MRLNNFLPTRPPPPDQFPTRPPPPDQSSEQREQERRSGFLLACRLGAMVGHAMACTHRAGYVHGDMGPQNIMLQFDRLDVNMMHFSKCKVILIDWGQARPIREWVSDWNPRDPAFWVPREQLSNSETMPPCAYTRPRLNNGAGNYFDMPFDMSVPATFKKFMENNGLVAQFEMAGEQDVARACNWGLLRAYEATLGIPRGKLNYTTWPHSLAPTDDEFMPVSEAVDIEAKPETVSPGYLFA